MGFFDRFPYSNPYQLNLDWIIAQMRKFEADYNQLDPESFLRKAGDKMSGDLNMDGHAITNIPAPVADSDAVNKKFVEDKIGTPEAPGAYLPLAGGMMSGDINMDGHRLGGIPNPLSGFDAVNKRYVDSGFAPSGYGLGRVGQTPTDNDANQITGSGFFRAFVNTPDPNVWWNIINIECYEDLKTAFQIANGYKSLGSSSICVRQKVDNVWGAWEWINPPMTLGIEYRTVECHNGKTVYTQYFKVGTAVNGAIVRKPSGASAIIRHQSYIGSLPLPLGNKYIERSGYFAYTTSTTDDGFSLITDTLSDGYGNGSYNWFEQMWYTK